MIFWMASLTRPDIVEDFLYFFLTVTEQSWVYGQMELLLASLSICLFSQLHKTGANNSAKVLDYPDAIPCVTQSYQQYKMETECIQGITVDMLTYCIGKQLYLNAAQIVNKSPLTTHPIVEIHCCLVCVGDMSNDSRCRQRCGCQHKTVS
jgi:hypothetical protein